VRLARPILVKGAPIVVLVVLAAAAAMIARDAATIQRVFDRSDLAFEAQPSAERLWRLDTTLPFAADAFSVEDDLLFRRALRAFAVDARRGENPYDFDRPAFRAEAQANLVAVEGSDLSAPLRSKAVSLQGVLAFDESISDPVNGPNLIRASVETFQRAVRIDPGNEEAKYNLEFLLRLLQPQAQRLRIRQNIPVYRPGRSAPGGGAARRGHGY
jgi:hypothetical protein